ncbi:NACHT domain-containing protein [bacterium]|nr:NACHT domain-containing protein [bacterium]
MASSKKHNRDFLNGINIIGSFLGAIIGSVLSTHVYNFPLGKAGFFSFAIAALLYFTVQFIINRILDNGNNKINPGSLSQKQRSTILRTLESYISKRLKDSLYTSEPIELTIRKDLEQVGRNQHRREAPESFGIRQLLRFLEDKDINRRMLILGEPGAGKTTTLLALAGELIEKAKGTPTDPIPVFLELSRLKDNSFKEWLRAEISHETGLDVEFEILRSGQFIPLLDGLDELSPGNQIKAVEGINEFLCESPSLPLIICCRSKVYNSYDRENFLDCLNGAVIIQPMSDAQIQTYLNSSINSDTWDEIQKIADLQKFFIPSEIYEDDVLGSLFRQVDKDIENFLRTPLFLNLIPEIWDKDFRIQSQEELIEAYVNQCLSVDAVSSGRREKSKKKSIWGGEKIPSKEKAQRYLSFLAKNMRGNNTIEFALEDISPRWLEVPYAFDLYNCVSFFGAFTLSILTLSFILKLYLFCLGRLLPIEWNVIGMTISAIFGLPFALALFQDLSAIHPGRKIIFFNRKDLGKIKPSLDNLIKLAGVFIFILLHLIPIYLVAFLYFTHWKNLKEYVSSLSPNHQIISILVIGFLILFLLGFPFQLFRAIPLWSGQRRRKVRLRKRPWMERSSTRIGSFLGFVLDSLLYGFRFPLFLAAVLFAVGVLLCMLFFVVAIVLGLLVLLLPPPNLEFLPWLL